MNAAVDTLQRPATRAASRPAQLALLGTGTVGSAFVRRYVQVGQRLGLPPLGVIANSRAALACHGNPSLALAAVAASERAADGCAIDPDMFRAGDIVVDASASDAVASWHAPLLARGVHVVTANKLGMGASLGRAQSILAARHGRHARYGDAATVGAGLPLLASIRALVRGGDRIHAVEGVLSGSLAWLFNRYDGMRPFSGFVRQAREAGYTELDPRVDLSGEDVRRKLLILARAAGHALAHEDVRVESLVPPLLRDASPERVGDLLDVLDAPIRARFQQARRDGAVLRFVGRFVAENDGRLVATVGLRALPAGHALSGGDGTDNRVAIHSDRYAAQPLVIQGPGAGADVTAAALVDDIVGIVSSTPGAHLA